MTTPVAVDFTETDLDAIAKTEGRVAVFVTSEGKLDVAARRVNLPCSALHSTKSSFRYYRNSIRK